MPPIAQDDFPAVTAFDVSDDNPRVIVEHMRALQREVRDGFELVTNKLLTALERLNNRFDALADDVVDLRRRQDRMEQRITALETKRRSPAKKRK